MAVARAIAVTTPLGDDVLRFRRMVGTEELGRLFEFTVDLHADDEQIRVEDVLGQPMTIELELAGDEMRYFNGIVTEFRQVGRSGNHAWYQATLRPWLWLLTRSSDCRIFQNMTVPDIVRQVCEDHGFTAIEDSLSGTYEEREFVVQYRETAFNFVSRLMEDEGIYFYFVHEDGQHKMVLCDSSSSHESVTDFEELPYRPAQDEVRREPHVSDCQLVKRVKVLRPEWVRVRSSRPASRPGQARGRGNVYPRTPPARESQQCRDG